MGRSVPGGPTFLVIGAYNASTTSLTRQLDQHRGIFFPKVLEPSYFAFGDDGSWPRLLPPAGSDPYSRPRVGDRDRYLRLFASARPGQIGGECSPEYLRQAGTAARIQRLDAEIRLLAVLRDPVERAWSDYMLQRRNGVEARPFAEAIDSDAVLAGTGAPAHYVETGRYGRQLAEYFERFAPEQLMVLILEEWRERRAEMLRQVCRHLGVADDHRFDVRVHHNVSGEPADRVTAAWYRLCRRVSPRVRERVPLRIRVAGEALTVGRLRRRPMPAELATALRHRYHEDRLQLESLLGRAIEVWPR